MTTESPRWVTSRWVTSSYSGNGGQCVEVAVDLVASRGTVPVRDSKDPHGPTLDFPATSFASFVAGIKSGELPLA